MVSASELMSATFTLTTPVAHPGVPDGSAGVAVASDYFVAACDEDNILRLFSTDGGKSPRELLDLNPHLGFPAKKRKFKECDIEGASRSGNLIYWMGSHGRSKDGEVRESRRVFFATEVRGSGAGTTLSMFGSPCTSLLDVLVSDARLKSFRIEEAASRAPEEEGALNIEAICADGDSLLIGFRNPIAAQGALIVPLLNPRATVEGARPRIGAPIILSLGGQGLRDMAKWSGRFLIVSGSFGDRKATGATPSNLWLWSGHDAVRPVRLAGDMGALNPEAILVHGEDERATIRLLSDDGGDSFRSVGVTINSDQ